MCPETIALKIHSERIPRFGPARAKRSVNTIVSALDQAIMHMDSDQFLLTTKTEDYVKAITAFMEKRKPESKGN